MGEADDKRVKLMGVECGETRTSCVLILSVTDQGGRKTSFVLWLEKLFTILIKD